MFAIVDCNSFYCSCERVFQPKHQFEPIVVLSNNDGCIIARTDEAKELGIAMGAPFFQEKKRIEAAGVAVYSSNYNLYGDMSRRVMQILKDEVGIEHVEVYSVDEAFLHLHHIPANMYEEFLASLRNKIGMWTGIQVSIGAAPTKVLSKVANRLAKKNKKGTNCLMILSTDEQIQHALTKTPIEDLWGIGRRYAEKLRQWNITTGANLQSMPLSWASKHLGGVVGERLLRELKGEPCIPLQEPRTDKQMIATTRMFGHTVTELKDLEEAVATYTARAAEKLRRQHAVAGGISVFVIEKAPPVAGKFRHGPSRSSFYLMPVATAATNLLIKPALSMIRQLFKPGQSYKKAGVLLSHIVPETHVQTTLFGQPAGKENKKLMEIIDNINFSQRNDILQFATTGTSRNWKMQRGYKSRHYTTRWDELRDVF